MSFLNQFMDESPRDELLSSVRRHLQNVLSSRRGFASYVHTFGLVEYSAHSTSRTVATVIMREILDNVASYEPRLLAYDLIALDQDADHHLHLILRGELYGRPCLFHIAFHMALCWLTVVDARWAERGEDLGVT